jgi:hypothetical protein
MPGQHTVHDVIVTWFPIRQLSTDHEELDLPVCTETLPRRRVWTATRDLISASTEHEQWRQPLPDEWAKWDLGAPRDGQLDAEAAWLVATTGEPGLGVPTRMAVRLQELVVR